MPSTPQTTQPQRQHGPWTEAMVERLTKLWTKDGCTIGEIAADLSRDAGRTLTRSAVTGKIDRLGLVGKGAMPGKGGRRRRECAAASQRKPIAPATQVMQTEPAPAPPAAPEAERPAQPVQPNPGALHPPGRWPLVDMRPFGQCKFACTEESGRHLFCGEPAPIGPGNPHGSWCEAHRSQVFTESVSLDRPAFLKRRAVVR